MQLVTLMSLIVAGFGVYLIWDMLGAGAWATVAAGVLVLVIFAAHQGGLVGKRASRKRMQP
jgi:hypothetical protein